jgi:hypothetical protein
MIWVFPQLLKLSGGGGGEEKEGEEHWWLQDRGRRTWNFFFPIFKIRDDI